MSYFQSCKIRILKREEDNGMWDINKQDIGFVDFNNVQSTPDTAEIAL